MRRNNQTKQGRRILNMFLFFALFILFPFAGFSQGEATDLPSNSLGLIGELSNTDPVLLTLIGMVLVLIIAIMFLLMYLAAMMNYIWIDKKKTEAAAKGVAFESESVIQKLKERFISGKLLKPEQEQGEMLLDHEYDGIREMDYGMPPWLRTFFIVTIGFAVFYLASMYFFGGIKGTIDEYEQEMEIARVERNERMKFLANSIDENTVEVSTDKTLLVNGAAIFAKECKACHGAYGEGISGPNLTDEYWLHGGSINDVFKTIKYGITEKGMISWQKKLNPADMNAVANYVISLGGTNPANAKAPEGEPYEPQKVQEIASGTEMTE